MASTIACAALVATGCASPLQRVATKPNANNQTNAASRSPVGGREVVGVAFGGGSAKGIAHVGVIQWLEEHRIPIDVAAGTSMGGLIGGAYATGMDGAELSNFINSLDWDQLFGASSFANKNLRRKIDARAYPSRLEFGLRGGLVPPAALNNGEQVELLLARITAPYYGMATFDELPTPFRTVAVDLLSAQPVILSSGSLADAMRSTMSLPLIFPPVDLNGQVLIDGGTMNNVPADVVRSMGANRVIAINVGDLTDREQVSTSMLGVAGETIGAMMRASSRETIGAANVVLNVQLDGLGSLDWRRSKELIDAGYRSAEAMKDRLLPWAVSEEEFAKWKAGRTARRRTTLPPLTYVQLDGFASDDTERLQTLLERHVGMPPDISAIEKDMAQISGLDRYQSVVWEMMSDPARGEGLRLRARLKPSAPPFMMLGVNMENTSSSDFRVTMTARYLGYDVIGSGSELRLDATIGSDPTMAFELYRPIGPRRFFVAPYAGGKRETFDVVQDGAVISRYQRTLMKGGANIGVNLGAWSDLRAGAYVGRSTADIKIGVPGLPELEGAEEAAELAWRLDTQDSPVVPSRGVYSRVLFTHIFDSPHLSDGTQPANFSQSYSQLSGTMTQFWKAGEKGRVFAYLGGGTSFDGAPVPINQFSLGTPFRLGAFNPGEARGAHYYIATAGYLRRIGRLPDFMGNDVFGGAWLDNGDAFDNSADAEWRTHTGIGLIADTLFGPVMLGGTWSYDGRWSAFFGVGRTFR